MREYSTYNKKTQCLKMDANRSETACLLFLLRGIYTKDSIKNIKTYNK